jgi:hypothetical protein
VLACVTNQESVIVKSKTIPFFVPTLSEALPDFAMRLQRRDDMQAKLSKAQQESAALHARIDARRVTAPDSARAERVAALLGDGIASDGLSGGLDSARLSELDRTIGDMKVALVEMNKRVVAARGAASTKICERVRPEHQRRAGAICAKLVELHAAVADYVELADALNASDVAWQGIMPCHPKFLGRPNDQYGAIAVYLRQAVRDGNFDAKNLPVELS